MRVPLRGRRGNACAGGSECSVSRLAAVADGAECDARVAGWRESASFTDTPLAAHRVPALAAGIVARRAGTRTAGFGLAAARPRAVRTDRARSTWHRAGMTHTRKRRPLDLFLDALLHPVRFR
jgi:hypothetical protein